MNDILIQKLKEVQGEVKGVPGVQFPNPLTGPDAPTTKQVDFYRSLVLGKQMSDEQRDYLAKMISSYNRRAMTTLISWLVTLPWTPRPVAAPKVQSVPTLIKEGRYAVERVPGDLRFYEIRQPKDGKWAGYTFVSQLSGENRIPMRDKQERDTVFALIAKDVLGSLRLYGQKIGRCGHCRKQLTDAVSRDFGIGPVCRKALGV